jgi:hypothetical protein
MSRETVNLYGRLRPSKVKRIRELSEIYDKTFELTP